MSKRLFVTTIAVLLIAILLTYNIAYAQYITSISQIEDFNYVSVHIYVYKYILTGNGTLYIDKETYVAIWDEVYNNPTKAKRDSLYYDAIMYHIPSEGYLIDPCDINKVEHCAIAQWEDYHMDYIDALIYKSLGNRDNYNWFMNASAMNYHGYMMIYYWYLYLKCYDYVFVYHAYKEFRDWKLHIWFDYAAWLHKQADDIDWYKHYQNCYVIAMEVNATYWALQEAPPGAV